MLFGVGLDTEPWGGAAPPDLAVRMAWGMARGNFAAFNYGSAGGCGSATGCKGPWTRDHMVRVSNGWPGQGFEINNLPQIYSPTHVNDWLSVAKYWRNKGHQFAFEGITFQQEADKCRGGFSGSAPAWHKLKTLAAPGLGREAVMFDCPWDS